MAKMGRPWRDHKPPSSAPVWGIIEGFGAYYLLLTALELGVFDVMASDGPTPVGLLADRLEVSPTHLAGLLDSLVALALLERVDERFGLNETAERYLVSGGPASLADLVGVAPGPRENWLGLAETIRQGRPANPIEGDPAAFYVPLVEGTFTKVFRAASRADLKIRYSALTAPRVLDLGAGGAPWAMAVLSKCPKATAVVNDLPGVLPVAQRKAQEHGVAERCTFLPGNFHEVPLEEEAFDLVVLGHVCRTEGVDGAQHLIHRAYRALRPGGRVLLADYFVDPDRRYNPHGVLMGMTMMASTLEGFALTNAQATQWLRAAGFVNRRLIEPIGNQFVYVATRAEKRSR